jgi:hypothetical protein
MIDSTEKLKTELITRNIAYENEMSGCSESEIQVIEAKYGKLPISYRQIISLIGHSAGLLIGEKMLSFYVSLDDSIDRIIEENEIYRQFRKETIENNEVDDELLKIPEYIFIIYSWDGNNWFILTDPQKNKKDSPVYIYQDNGMVVKESLSVWEWINGIVSTSFKGSRSNKNIKYYSTAGYRKPLYLDSRKKIIKKGYFS